MPPERVSQVIDFAQFLEFQITKTHEEILNDVNEEKIVAENAQWDGLLATDES